MCMNQSTSARRYFLVFKDECTSFRKNISSRHKSEVFEEFKDTKDHGNNSRNSIIIIPYAGIERSRQAENAAYC